MDEMILELRKCFLDEATQNLEEMEKAFLALESVSEAETKPIINTLFRLAHNLKGSSRSVGFNELSQLTHAMEDVLSALRSETLIRSDGVINELFATCDIVKNMVTSLKENPEFSMSIKEQVEILQSVLKGEPTIGPTLAVSQANDQNGSIGGFEMFDDHHPNNQTLAQQKSYDNNPPEKNSLPPPTPAANSKKTSDPIRIDSSRIDALNDLVGELVIMHSIISEQLSKPQNLEVSIKQLGTLCRDIQSRSMGLRMVPFGGYTTKLQRLVRDTAKAVGKKVELVIEGAETQLDKSVFDLLSDPLVHLVRNSVDHGLETEVVRTKSGKSAVGTVTVRACYEGSNLVVDISDDGKGIDAQAIRLSALKKGLIKDNLKLSTEEMLDLLFLPGFSTRTEVSEISGRGVGLDVVRSAAVQIGGSARIMTELGKGSCFKLTLPLSLAIIDGLIVKVGANRLVIPLSQVQETVSPSIFKINQVKAIGDCMDLRGRFVKTVALGDMITAKHQFNRADEQIAIVSKLSKDNFAVLVDDIVGKQQVVIKKLDSEMDKHPEYSGVVILGDGQPSLVVDLAMIGSKIMNTPKLRGIA